jgi:hypothetical protein
MIDRSLCLCGSFHPLALEKCILEYILPTKAGRANIFFLAGEEQEIIILKNGDWTYV